ncbi:MAG TPA: septum formation initiator family protein [Candidatus Eremiobacteraceae bacterium]|nr:septum formation initiator family protein [Candidatus Eremiobacteraceae bacterium]
MTARRGSLRFKIKRIAAERVGTAAKPPRWRKRLILWTRLGSRLVVGAAVLALAGAFGAQTYRIAAENYRLHVQVDDVERRNTALSADAARMQKQIVLLHDPDYLVPLIHEQLGLVKPHEVFIVVAPAPASPK